MNGVYEFMATAVGVLLLSIAAWYAVWQLGLYFRHEERERENQGEL